MPFHVLLNMDMAIEAIGPGIKKLIPQISLGDSFQDHFTLGRPHHLTTEARDFEQICERLLLVESNHSDLQMRGAFWKLKAQFLFAASPLLNKAEDMDRLGLVMTDFAPNDPIPDFLFAIRARDVTLKEIRHAISRQQLLTRELDHRVKNTLSAILSLVSLTSSEATDIDDFASRFEGRVKAMSLAHELLATAGWQQVKLNELIHTVLGGHLQVKSGGLLTEGPDAPIAPRQAGPLSMTIHELGMNAFKYGAWSTQGGLIKVHWTLDQDSLCMTWRETRGPPITTEPVHGVGLGLVIGFIEHELHGIAKLDFKETGLEAEFQIPISN